jgi:hypothetical protein
MKRAATALMFSAILFGFGVGKATAAGDAVLRYKEVGGNGPILVVKGIGCLQAEDSLRLKVVSYTGEKVVYRCVVP